MSDKNIERIESKAPRFTDSFATEINNKGFVEIYKMIEGEKIPKGMIEIVSCKHNEINITVSHCSLRKDHESLGTTSIDLTGEYSGNCGIRVLIMIMIYNANCELIGYVANIGVRPEFTGQGTFYKSVSIPSDETISKVIVRIIPDPTWL